jgi:hypothetical protein
MKKIGILYKMNKLKLIIYQLIYYNDFYLGNSG